MTRPASMTATSSASCSASSMWCVVRITEDAVAAQVPYEVPGGAAGLRIQAGGGLVQEHQLGAADDGHRQGEPLLLAAGESAVRRPAARAEAEPLDQRVDVQRVGVQLRDVAQHLVRAGAGVDAAGLEHHADPGPQLGALCHRVEAQHAHRAGVGPAVTLCRSRRWSSCPPRWGRVRRSHPPGPPGRGRPPRSSCRTASPGPGPGPRARFAWVTSLGTRPGTQARGCGISSGGVGVQGRSWGPVNACGPGRRTPLRAVCGRPRGGPRH